jgi:hypothetical protein
MTSNPGILRVLAKVGSASEAQLQGEQGTMCGHFTLSWLLKVGEPRQKCPELQGLRDYLWKRQPVQLESV